VKLINRTATAEDLAQSMMMLVEIEEEIDTPLNPGVVARSFANQQLHVLRDSSKLLGFCVDSDLGIDLVAVDHKNWGQGFGRELVRHSIARARDRGLSVLEVDCISSASLAFADCLGFTIRPNRMGLGGGRLAYMELSNQLDLPAGNEVSFKIDFCPPERDFDQTVGPFRTLEGKGVRLGGNSLHIPARAVCYHPDILLLHDCVVVVHVDGQLIFEDKVKREEAKKLGVVRDLGGHFFIERINLT